MSVAVIVPLQIDGLYRQLAWQREVEPYLAQFGWPIHVAPGVDDGWRKAEAIARKVRDVDADVLVIHDADVLMHDPGAMRDAVAAVESGEPWAVPHMDVYRMDETTTDRLYTHGYFPPMRMLEREPYPGVAGGGVTVVRDDVWQDCPMDRRFVGWGGEDVAWGCALECLYGPPIRYEEPLIHLWHPSQARDERQRGPRTLDGQKLVTAYRRAKRSPAHMRKVLTAARLTAT